MIEFRKILKDNLQGKAVGIYSVCSAHPLVIEAALLQGKRDKSLVLIEATANQVNQFGGYTQMQPHDFIQYVKAIALKTGFAEERLLFGGDHLGPTCWTNETSHSAMLKSEQLIKAYVTAGFKKIHLDTSMPCADDQPSLTDLQVAERAARLCAVAEQAALDTFGYSDLVYVVGTEVPPPGGAGEQSQQLKPTPVASVKSTITAHKVAFEQLQLEDAWSRVVALVVQPGVEFDNYQTHDYQPQQAQHLANLITEYGQFVYEAHSTDYQPQAVYQQLVRDHFAILKVGPQLTFALREALFALSFIEEQLIPAKQCSRLREVCEQQMLEHPHAWQKFYSHQATQLLRAYSYSDRIRYYWPDSIIQSAIEQLLDNLEKVQVPLPLLSQFLPGQYRALRDKQLENNPRQWLLHHIMQVTQTYSLACQERK